MFNNNLRETPINSAYIFETTNINNQFIQTGLKNGFSPICVFCSCKDSISLMKDGSFRSCNNCRKQFKARPL
jgi:uncharacterized CHY-type Zn-finger protein